MAITINGSGTITGVSAGGLPDGSVDADTLASTLDLSGKTMTYGLTDSDLSSVTTGKIIQIVNADYAGQTVTSSSSFQDTGLSASITPTSASNKILVEVHQTGLEKRSSDTVIDVSLFRDSSEIQSFLIDGGWTADSNPIRFGGAGVTKLDSPNTTSSVTYKTMFRGTGSADVRVQSSGSRSSITLYEVAV